MLAAGLGAAAGGMLASCSSADAPLDVDDVAGIKQVRVSRVLRPRSTTAVARILAETRGGVSIGGARYSMGGQVAAPGSLHLDMRALGRVLVVDPARRIARVQAGVRWRDLQEHLDPHDLAVRIMQSYSNFSVGGSLSVNCHGRYVGAGPLVNSVRAIRLVTADGDVRELTRQQDAELFGAVCGGYGGLGVITEVEVDLAANTRLERRVEAVALEDYPAYVRERIAGRSDVVLHNADLYPPAFDRPVAISWHRTDAPVTEHRRLVPRGLDYTREKNLIWAVSELPGGAALREKLAARELDEPVVQWRNFQASLDAAALEPRTRRMSTYLLQEYFVPVAAFTAFARSMASILQASDAQVLNVSLRHSPRDPTSLLAWARDDVFSFVLYHKQRRVPGADAATAAWTRRLVDASLDVGGRHYLPYRRHATLAQFERGYPAIDAFAAIKARIDPAYRFRNLLWDRYLR
ncbi:FAD-binding oxidoreductase [Lysobacter humi (ex Lee et al. 2017)]